MKKRIVLRESDIRKIVRQALRESLDERTNTYPYREFVRDLGYLGFQKTEGAGSGEKWCYRVDDDKHKEAVVTIHRKPEVDANMLGNVIKELERKGYFDSVRNRKAFEPIRLKWNSKKIEGVDTTDEEIEEANAKYANAKLTRVFYDENPLCALEAEPGMVNLCRSPEDRRPLLDTWFEAFKYADDGRPVLEMDVIESEDVMYTKAFPILPDGSLDMGKVFTYESKKYYGKLLT